jgi:YHS domain-containing protein
MAERRTIAPNEDPVCGMTVDVADARKKGMTREYEGREYVFCGKGCYLEFGDDPESFLAEGYVAEM